MGRENEVSMFLKNGSIYLQVLSPEQFYHLYHCENLKYYIFYSVFKLWNVIMKPEILNTSHSCKLQLLIIITFLLHPCILISLLTELLEDKLPMNVPVHIVVSLYFPGTCRAMKFHIWWMELSLACHIYYLCKYTLIYLL
jgi:hypothetical protein